MSGYHHEDVAYVLGLTRPHMSTAEQTAIIDRVAGPVAVENVWDERNAYKDGQYDRARGVTLSTVISLMDDDNRGADYWQGIAEAVALDPCEGCGAATDESLSIAGRGWVPLCEPCMVAHLSLPYDEQE